MKKRVILLFLTLSIILSLTGCRENVMHDTGTADEEVAETHSVISVIS